MAVLIREQEMAQQVVAAVVVVVLLAEHQQVELELLIKALPVELVYQELMIQVAAAAEQVLLDNLALILLQAAVVMAVTVLPHLSQVHP